MPSKSSPKKQSKSGTKGKKIIKKVFDIPDFTNPDRELTKEEILALKSDVIRSKPLLSWEAYSRVYKKRTKMYYINIAVIVFLLGLIAITINEPIVAMLILSLGFVAYVLAYVEPPIINNSITKLGIISGGNAYLWSELGSFWFSQRNKQTILNITQNKLRPALIFIIKDKDIDNIIDILSDHLEYRRNYKGLIVDKMADTLVEKVPLE